MILMGCYRKSDANDPEIYTSAVVSVLMRYSAEVAIAVTEPATGLPSRLKWLPSIADLVEACEDGAEAERETRRSRHDDAVRETMVRRVEDLRPKLTEAERAVHVGEVLRKHGFCDLGRKFG